VEINKSTWNSIWKFGNKRGIQEIKEEINIDARERNFCSAFALIAVCLLVLLVCVACAFCSV
jgi:hypothetical protein